VNNLSYWTPDNATFRSNVDYAEVVFSFWKDEVDSTKSPLFRGQIVVLDDDHVTVAEIFRGKLPLVALVKLF